MTVHAEAVSVRFDEGVRIVDDTMHGVFDWAAVQLLSGAPAVKVWVSGDRNVPLNVTQFNYAEMRRQWVEGR